MCLRVQRKDAILLYKRGMLSTAQGIFLRAQEKRLKMSTPLSMLRPSPLTDYASMFVPLTKLHRSASTVTMRQQQL